jgi:ATP-binding cassette subfamily B protein AbcA/BmrA
VIKNVFLNIKPDIKNWLLALVVTQIIPLLEVAFILTLQVLLDGNTEKYIQYLKILNSVTVSEESINNHVEQNMTTIVMMIGVVLLVVFQTLKYHNLDRLNRLARAGQARDAEQIVGLIVNSSTEVIRGIPRNKLTSILMQDCGVQSDIARRYVEIIGAFSTLVMYMVSAIYLSWKMLALALILYIFPLWVSRAAFKKIHDLGKLKVKIHADTVGWMTEFIQGHKRLKVDGLEWLIRIRSLEILGKTFSWRYSKKKTQLKFNITNDGLTLMGLVFTIYFGITILGIELAILMTLFIMFARLKGSVAIISNEALFIRETTPQYYRYLSLMKDLSKTLHTGADSVKEKGIKINKIELIDVSFSYDGKNNVLHDLNLNLVAGDRVLIQGPSGSGKTSLLEIVCGLVKPNFGLVKVNDKTLDESFFYTVRERISYNSSSLYLFKGSIKENILYGDIKVGDNQLQQAIRSSNLSEVVEKLSKGLDSEIGFNGENLSLGQRQRLILARLFVRNPDLILLDEITSNLDKELEEEVMSSVQKFTRPEAVIIVVSHAVPRGYYFNKKFILSSGLLTLCK